MLARMIKQHPIGGNQSMKHYKISEFSAMVGLPQSKIRFYEKYGLFDGKRHENGYRYFTPEDAFRVNAFRTLLQYGFTVEQAIQMLDEKQSEEVFLRSLENQKRHLNRECQLLTYRLQRLEYAMALIKSESGSDFQVVDQEDYLYVHASYGRDFTISVENEDLIARFVEVLSISSYARLIPLADFDNDSEQINPSYITAIPLNEASRLELDDFDAAAGLPEQKSVPADPRLHRLKLGKCLRFHRHATREQSVRKETFREPFAYLAEHGYAVRSDFVIFPSFLNLDGQGQDVETVFIPIR